MMRPSIRMARPRFTIVPIACIVAALLLVPAVVIAEPQQKPQPRIDPIDLAARIHALVNEERTKRKLPALAWNDRLAAIAGTHSRDMAERDYVAHDSPEGRRFTDRYRAGRFECAIRVGNTIYTGAENIALNHLYNSVTVVNGKKIYHWNSAGNIAHRAVTNWMNSPGHRRNILTPHWRNEGIGVTVAPDNKVYVTQNFC